MLVFFFTMAMHVSGMKTQNLRTGGLYKAYINTSPAQTRSLQTSDVKHSVVQCKYLPLSHLQCGSEFALTDFPIQRKKKKQKKASSF